MPATTPLTRPIVPPLPRNRRAHRPSAADALLDQARQGLLDAEYAAHPVDRYSHAQLAALRAAAAVVAARARPDRRARPASAWVLLAKVAPELAEWSAFFAAASATRTAAESGVRRLVTTRDADDLIRQAGEFLALAHQVAARTPR
ncbi:MAG: SAV_6107 family HEPN domain-containing protein [Pseudonocardiaceae bacterium]